VVVLVTDAPADDLQSCFLTIHEVVLFGELVEPQIVYASSEGWRCDLLSLRSGATQFHEMLASDIQVAMGTYDVVRLRVEDPKLVLQTGAVVEDIELAAGGNLDIELREPLQVVPDDKVFLLLDIDVERSVLRPDAENDSWQIRPLVWVDAVRDEILDAVETPSDVRGRFLEADGKGGAHSMSLGDGRGIVDVEINEETLVFDADGELVDSEPRFLGRDASVRGFLDETGRLEARVILLGAGATLSATLLEAPKPLSYGTALLAVGVDTPYGIQRTLEVEVSDTTVFSDDRSQDIDLQSLNAGDSLHITVTRDSVTNPAPAALIVDRIRGGNLQDERRTLEKLSGVLYSVDPRSRTIVVGSSGGRRIVRFPDEADLLFVEELDDAVHQGVIDWNELEVGTRVEVEVQAEVPAEGEVGLRGNLLVETSD
jgi:hypothetical protein